MAHYDLVQRVRDTWDPFHVRAIKVKSQRSLDSAHSTPDLYSILGNTLADETAKVTNKQDICLLQATQAIFQHTEAQIAALLHSKINLDKENQVDGDAQTKGIDEISHCSEILVNWKVRCPCWTFVGTLCQSLHTLALPDFRLPPLCGNSFTRWYGVIQICLCVSRTMVLSGMSWPLYFVFW